MKDVVREKVKWETRDEIKLLEKWLAEKKVAVLEGYKRGFSLRRVWRSQDRALNLDKKEIERWLALNVQKGGRI